MSRSLLEKLNGGKNGEFARWLAKHPWEVRISWYPSCLSDFKDLLYLHKSESRRGSRGLPEPPEIFIHTDCLIGLRVRAFLPPAGGMVLSAVSQPDVLHEDEWTTVSVMSIEELPRLDVSVESVRRGLSQFTEPSPDYGRLFFLLLHIESDRLGSLVQPLLYAVAENGAFASQVLLANNARVTHIWNVLPGGKPSFWIGLLLKRLNTECLIREERSSKSRKAYDEDELNNIDPRYSELFENLLGGEEDRLSVQNWQYKTSFSGTARNLKFNVYVQPGSKSEKRQSIRSKLSAASDQVAWLNKWGFFFGYESIYEYFICLGLEPLIVDYPLRGDKDLLEYVVRRIFENKERLTEEINQICAVRKCSAFMNFADEGSTVSLSIKTRRSTSEERFFWQVEQVLDGFKAVLNEEFEAI